MSCRCAVHSGNYNFAADILLVAIISKLSRPFVLLRDDIQNSAVTNLQQGRGHVVRLSKLIVNFRSRICYRNLLYARETTEET